MANNVLILAAGRRVELVQAFQQEARELIPSGKIMAGDLRPELSAACHVADRSIGLPPIRGGGYIDELRDICVEHDVGLVVPTIDTDLLILAENREAFAALGIAVLISEPAFVAKCRDKRLTSRIFADIGLPSPREFSRNNIEYPAFAKPFDGSSSIGVKVLRSSSDLTEDIIGDPRMMFMEYIDQSYEEHTVDAYFDRHGALKCLVPRRRIETRAGEISKGITRAGALYDFCFEHFARLEGARGCITIQLFAGPEDDRFFGIEINPRFGGGFPLSYAAGARYPRWLIEEYLLDREVAFFDEWRAGVLMLRYDAKVIVEPQAS
jgi:carbamoyl-phosphate synthase large subunit